MCVSLPARAYHGAGSAGAFAFDVSDHVRVEFLETQLGLAHKHRSLSERLTAIEAAARAMEWMPDAME